MFLDSELRIHFTPLYPASSMGGLDHDQKAKFTSTEALVHHQRLEAASLNKLRSLRQH
jgi:hypothetical protein